MTSPSTAAAKAAFAAATATAPAFTPRAVFEVSASTPRSYFLGHQHAALSRMQTVLANIGLVIECRDFRVPLTSWNPLLETSLLSAAPAATGTRSRIIVYTKRDLGPPATAGPGPGPEIVSRLSAFHQRRGQTALFLGTELAGRTGANRVLDAIKRVAREHDSLTGLRALVVGMPNVGKSTLLNKLRALGMSKAKVAKTGAQPGVTRKLSTPVRIVPAEGADGGGDDDLDAGRMGEGVFIMDTPGVFMPYLHDAESMLRLALVGCVKPGLVPHVTLADYLLFHLNRHDPALYAEYAAPTNEVHDFLAGVGRRTGKLARGGQPSLEAAADWVVQEWRRGVLGRFVLDDVSDEAVRRAAEEKADPPLSMTQRRKREKEARKTDREARMLARRQDSP